MELTNTYKVESILRHVRRVEDNCCIIAMKLLDTDKDFALELIRRGRLHDLSKLERFEFDHLWEDDERFKEAHTIHRARNRHHPEHFEKGLPEMTELDIAEMVADCMARAQQFGTDIRQWFSQPMYDSRREDIEKYLDLLVTKRFIYTHGT